MFVVWTNGTGTAVQDSINQNNSNYSQLKSCVRMRRSLAPSQLKKNDSILPVDCEPAADSSNKRRLSSAPGEVVIERMPLFGFLEIPGDLRKQFRVPTGCKITERYVGQEVL